MNTKVEHINGAHITIGEGVTVVADTPAEMEERYLTAVSSKHLAMNLEAPCTLDLLIAAGKVADPVVVALFRLRGEFDTAMGKVQSAEGNQRRLQDQIAAQKIKSKRPKANKEEIAEEIEKLEKELAHQTASDAFYIVEHLHALEGTKQVFGAWVRLQADKFPLRGLPPAPRAPGPKATAEQLERHRLAHERHHRRVVQAAQENSLGTNKDVAAIAGRVLQAYLLKNCHKCAGRAFVGKHGKPQMQCTACHGTGKARFSVGRTDAERAFVEHLLTEIDNKVNETKLQMRRFLSQR